MQKKDHALYPFSHRTPLFLSFALGIIFSIVAARFPVEAAAYPHAKLSGSMVAGGTAYSLQISPNGDYLVFRADKETLGVIELYSVNLATRAIVKLNGSLLNGTDVNDFLISPAGTRVVFQTTNTTNGRALFTVPIGGGEVENISHPLALLADRSENFEITPSGNTVVFRSNVSGRFEVYKSPITGVTIADPPFKLNPPMVPNGKVEWARLSPDGSRVVYKADAVTLNQVDLFTVPLSGVGANRILPPLSDWDINQFGFSPDNARIVYTTFGGGNSRLYSVPVAGGTPTRLDNPSVSKYYIGHFMISPNSDWVVYSGQQTSDKYELFSVPTAGPGTLSRRLNPDLPDFADLNGPGDTGMWEISTDGQYVIYNADLDVDEQFNLYRVPIAGPAENRVIVNHPFSEGNGVTGGRYLCSGEWILFYLKVAGSPFSESFLVPSSLNRLPQSLTGSFVPLGQYLEASLVSPDCRWLVMRIHTGPLAENQGYTLPLGAVTPSRFHPDFLDPPGGIAQMLFSPDSRTLYYLADAEVNDRREIYMTGLYALHLPLLLKDP